MAANDNDMFLEQMQQRVTTQGQTPTTKSSKDTKGKGKNNTKSKTTKVKTPTKKKTTKDKTPTSKSKTTQGTTPTTKSETTKGKTPTTKSKTTKSKTTKSKTTKGKGENTIGDESVDPHGLFVQVGKHTFAMPTLGEGGPRLQKDGTGMEAIGIMRNAKVRFISPVAACLCCSKAGRILRHYGLPLPDICGSFPKCCERFFVQVKQQ